MKKLRWTWDNFEEVLLCIIITVITLVSGLQVVCRYLFNNSLTWSEEVSRYLFVWTGFLTLSLSMHFPYIPNFDKRYGGLYGSQTDYASEYCREGF